MLRGARDAFKLESSGRRASGVLIPASRDGTRLALAAARRRNRVRKRETIPDCRPDDAEISAVSFFAPARGQGAPGALMIVTAAICGAAVMAIEILGARIVGPFFGGSLFVWTALISVTLVSLAAGYASGGFLADRRGGPGLLVLLVLGAGFLTLFVPLERSAVLTACSHLGLRSGALAAAALLFGPPLLLLGAVSPVVVRLASPSPGHLGRTVGVLSAVSTAGSFAGTLATGYVLIPWIGVTRVLAMNGALLVGLAAILLLAQRRWAAATGVAALALLAAPGDAPLRAVVQPNGTKATELFRRESFYGVVKVIEYSYGERRTREMSIDGLIQGGADMADGASIYEYSYLLNWLPRAIRPEGRSCLVVGVGTGAIPRAYEALGVPTDVVDIDPAVLDAARRYFGFRVSGDVVLEDGRTFLRRSRRAWDYVILDVFSGDLTPSHFLSTEALAVVRSRLAPGGVLGLNLIASPGGDPFFPASVLRTLATTFRTVTSVSLADPADPAALGNLVVVAYDGPERPIPWDTLRREPMHPMTRETLLRSLGKTWTPPEGTPGEVITDDLDPLELPAQRAREAMRRAILQGTLPELLL